MRLAKKEIECAMLWTRVAGLRRERRGAGQVRGAPVGRGAFFAKWRLVFGVELKWCWFAGLWKFVGGLLNRIGAHWGTLEMRETVWVDFGGNLEIFGSKRGFVRNDRVLCGEIRMVWVPFVESFL